MRLLFYALLSFNFWVNTEALTGLSVQVDVSLSLSKRLSNYTGDRSTLLVPSLSI